MSLELAQTLKDLEIDRQLEKVTRQWKDLPPWVFCNENGGLLNPNHLRHRIFYGLLKKAGLRQVRFHDLRHSFASLLLQQGKSPVYVKEQLGHSSIQITVDCYGHLIPSGNKQAVDKLDTPTRPADFREQIRNPRATLRDAAQRSERKGVVDQAVIMGRYGVE